MSTENESEEEVVAAVGTKMMPGGKNVNTKQKLLMQGRHRERNQTTAAVGAVNSGLLLFQIATDIEPEDLSASESAAKLSIGGAVSSRVGVTVETEI